jgi:hypothetical protein
MYYRFNTESADKIKMVHFKVIFFLCNYLIMTLLYNFHNVMLKFTKIDINILSENEVEVMSDNVLLFIYSFIINNEQNISKLKSLNLTPSLKGINVRCTERYLCLSSYTIVCQKSF